MAANFIQEGDVITLQLPDFVNEFDVTDESISLNKSSGTAVANPSVLIQGSVVVVAGEAQLEEDTDYEVDYSTGKIKALEDGAVGAVSVSYRWLDESVEPVSYVAGQLVVFEALFGVVEADALNGNPLNIVIGGAQRLPKKAADNATLGAKAYWEDAEQHVTTTQGDNTLIGAFEKAAGASTGTCYVRLNSSF